MILFYISCLLCASVSKIISGRNIEAVSQYPMIGIFLNSVDLKKVGKWINIAIWNYAIYFGNDHGIFWPTFNNELNILQ